MSISNKEYIHLGPSTHGLLDPERVLAEIGLRPGQTLLDAGSGEGVFALPAARRVGESGRVYAVDVQAGSIAILREAAREQGLANVEAMEADLADPIPLADGTIDVCLLANVLHELVENGVADSALHGIARVLKAGGTLAVVDFRPELESPPGPPRATRLSPAQVAALVAPHGFAPQRVAWLGPYQYAVICRREV